MTDSQSNARELEKQLWQDYQLTDSQAKEVAKFITAYADQVAREARIDELSHLREEPLFKKKVVDNEDQRRRTGYVRCRVRVRGLIDSRIATLTSKEEH